MAVIPCGETPGECGTFSSVAENYKIEFTTSNGNPVLLSAAGVNGVCYTVVVKEKTIFTDYLLKYISTVVTNNWKLYPFHIEAKGEVELSRNTSGDLIVTIHDFYSTLTGSAGDTGKAFKAPLYTCGDFSLALAVSTSNSVPTTGWNMCVGGWWSACQTGGTSCTVDAYGNPCGGTMYWWNRWDLVGTPYEHSGNTPTRYNGSISFNLGQVESGVPIFIWARAARGSCGSAYFASKDGGVVQCSIYVAPSFSVCPPSVNSIEMTRDICADVIGATINVHIPTLGTSDVSLKILYQACNSESEWDDGKAGTVMVSNITENSDMSIELADYGIELVPNTTYYFKLYLSNDSVESDAIMVCECKTLFIPTANCVVPELSAEECEKLKSGEYLDEFEEEDMEECC